MPKLGPVPTPPPPIDPFKNQPAPGQIGVVPTNEVTAPAVEQSQPQIGVVTKRPTVVVNVQVPDTTVPLGPVPAAINPSPALPPAPPSVGVTKDETPVYPPPPPEKKPDLGTVKDISITAPPPPPDEIIGEPPPKVSQPVVIDPFAKKDE